MKKILPIFLIVSCFDSYKINYDKNGRTQYIESKDSKRYINYNMNSKKDNVPSSSVTINLSDLLKTESIYNTYSVGSYPVKETIFEPNQVTMILSMIFPIQNINIVELKDKVVDFMKGSKTKKESKYKISTFTAANETLTLKNNTTNFLSTSFELTEDIKEETGYFWIKVTTKEISKDNVVNILYLKYAVADEAEWKNILPHTDGYKKPLEVIYRSSNPSTIKEHSIVPKDEVRIVYNKIIDSEDYNVMYNKSEELFSIRKEAVGYDSYTIPANVTTEMQRLATRPTTMVEIIKYLKDVA